MPSKLTTSSACPLFLMVVEQEETTEDNLPLKFSIRYSPID